MSSSGPNTKDIFAEALRLEDPAEQVAYLNRLCAGKPTFGRDVKSLLSVYALAGDFLAI
jgi:hypothetical protein